MRKNFLAIWLFILAIVFTGCSGRAAVNNENTNGKAGAGQTKESETMVTAIKHVNILTMENDIILPNQTVLMKNGIIAEIGDTDSIKVPEGCEEIDAEGKYLIPGIIDMHTHIVDSNDLTLFLCNGVTTIRNMAEYPDVEKYPDSFQSTLNYTDALTLRNKINSGELAGPQIVQAGHVLDGDPPFHEALCTPLVEGSDIDSIVKSEKEKGYDYIKVYWNLPETDFNAIVQAAEKYGMKVVGHVPASIKYEEAIGSMYSIEHLTGMYDGASIMPDLGRLIQRANETGTWHCPTLIELRNLLPIDNPNFIALQNRPENKYIKEDLKEFWNKEIVRWGGLTGYAGEAMDYFQMLVGELYKGGVRIVAGTDCGVMPYVLPGFSIHEEMELLTTCGLSNYEALKAATIDAAKCLDQDDRIGSIAVGKKADIVLIDGDPLQDIKNTRKISGVMYNGKWLSEQRIKELLDSIVDSIQ